MSVLHGEEEAGVGGEAPTASSAGDPAPMKTEAGPATHKNRETDRQASPKCFGNVHIYTQCRKNGVLEDEGHKSSLKQKGEIWADFDR